MTYALQIATAVTVIANIAYWAFVANFARKS